MRFSFVSSFAARAILGLMPFVFGARQLLISSKKVPSTFGHGDLEVRVSWVWWACARR